MPRISIFALQVYCRTSEVVVTLKRHTDIFNFTGTEVRCLYMSDRSAPLDPRTVFKTDKGLEPFFEEEELTSLGDGLFREQEVLKGGALSPNTYKGWEGLVQAMETVLGTGKAGKLGEVTLANILEGYGVLDQEKLDQVLKGKQVDETLGQATVRLKILKLEEFLRGAVGPGRYFKPRNHGANDVGRFLIAKGKIDNIGLQNAVARQVETPGPLGAILTELNICKPEDLVGFEGVAMSLPAYDEPGEQLIRVGKITRSELLHYELRANKKSVMFLDELVQDKKVTQLEADQSQRWQDLKSKLRRDGVVRLGEVLVERGSLTKDQLIERLKYQVDHAAPLGALVVAMKLITPEDLAEALLAQDEKLSELVRRELRKKPKVVEAIPVVVNLPPPKPKLIIPWMEVFSLLAVLAVMASTALYTMENWERLTSTPDPMISEPIDQLFAFFAGDQSDPQDAYYTVEDLNTTKTELDRAKDLDPDFAESINRLGGSLTKQNDEADLLLKGINLMPTPTPAPIQTGGPVGPTPFNAAAPVFEIPEYSPPPDPARPAQIIPIIIETPGPVLAAVPATKPVAPALRPVAKPIAPAVKPAAAIAGKPVAQGTPRVTAAQMAGIATPPPPVVKVLPGISTTTVTKPAIKNSGVQEIRRIVLAPPPTPGPSGRPAPPPPPGKEMSPDRALNMRAIAELANGSPQKAREALAKAVNLATDSINPIILFNLGATDYKLGSYAQAAISFAKARDSLTNAVADLDRKVRPYFQMTGPPSVKPIRLLKALLRANTLLADTITYQGRAREALGEKSDAKRFYRDASILYRRNAELHTKLGDVYRLNSSTREAVSEYAQAAKANPRLPDPWKALSLIATAQDNAALANKYTAIYRRLSGQ